MNDKPDYSKPPYTEYVGRKFTAEIEFYVAEEATDSQIWEWLEYVLGGDSIASNHPLFEAGVSRLAVINLERTNLRRYVDWGVTSADGNCDGKGRIERDALMAKSTAKAQERTCK